MATLNQVRINKKQIKSDLKDFRAMLDDPSRPELSESRDILPFFKARPQLCAFMGTYDAYIVDFRNILTASDFDIFGDHVADLAVGAPTNHRYCFIEFEDACETSIFRKTPKSTPEWSPRFEHGFSQLLDWVLWIENNKGSQGFKNRFNTSSIQYLMLLVIGRDKYLADQGLKDRFAWRNESVFVAGKQVHCLTFDKLYEDLRLRLETRF
jgi:hypothetical protein